MKLLSRFLLPLSLCFPILGSSLKNSKNNQTHSKISSKNQTPQMDLEKTLPISIASNVNQNLIQKLTKNKITLNSKKNSHTNSDSGENLNITLNSNPKKLSSIEEEGLKVLKNLFNSYKSKSLFLKIEQELFVSALQTQLKSKGTLSLQGKKFRLALQGEPPSLVIFDGGFLWYQANTDEKIVFKLKDHPQIQILTGFFNEELFFKLWKIKQVKKWKRNLIFHLVPVKKEGLKEVFMKVGTYISELRLIWEDLDNWQKYQMSKPFYRKISEEDFQFSPEGFEVITETLEPENQ